MAKFVYAFEEGNKDMKTLLGGKGANLAEMKKIGLPVPDGFTLSTEACKAYYQNNKTMTEVLLGEVKASVIDLEKKTGKILGDTSKPLLVSVRSGSVISMPGMMDTVLNLGLNDETVEGLCLLSGPVFALDAYRRFIQMFSDVVIGIEKYKFDRIFDKYPIKDEKSLREIIEKFKALVVKDYHQSFPQDVYQQLFMAVQAVFDSWHNHRAVIYRKIHNISDDLGTAVNVQSMVFGNFSNTSGTGVAFTRNPSTGEAKLYGEYLINAQGEDVVAGIRTPETIETLQRDMPAIYEQFVQVTHILEDHYKDMQDIEFTIEDGKLFLLQTRTGKRTAHAALQIAVDLVDEDKIDIKTALMRLEPNEMNQLLHPTFSKAHLQNAQLLAKGLPASPGAATGKIYFDSEAVKDAVQQGEEVILVRTETSPEDIEGMLHASGILTARGGMTSHAAVVARGMGKCCIAGCPDVQVEQYLNRVLIGNVELKEGDYISLDGSTGEIYLGKVEAAEVILSDAFQKVMQWADDVRRLKIRTNADTAHDASVAIGFGAEGIGLCRTEHMFFEKNRIKEVRRLILSEFQEDRLEALQNILPYQKQDFYELLKVMGERPVTIRLLDPPLHEFLPHEGAEIKALAHELNRSENNIRQSIENIKEVNPMLGHRGCRLGITYPEIYNMQVEAIYEAFCDLKEEGIVTSPEIMIPLIGFDTELKVLKKNVLKTAEMVLNRRSLEGKVTVGTMIEVPRAALTADEIAQEAEFFSFGTNDLTQMTLGFSRDDSAKFIHGYMNQKIFEVDPFESIDVKGIGKLMILAKTLGRSSRPDLKIGICGEHGGEPRSIQFCHDIGLDYVSCSPYRVPIAKLAAAKAAIQSEGKC